jgi:hypothetical protein
MSPAEHRRAAAVMREVDPADDPRESLRALNLARHHENLAKLIERRQTPANPNS